LSVYIKDQGRIEKRGEITMLNVQHKNLGTVSILNLEGQFVVGETDSLRGVMQSLPASSSVILDLSHVTLVDAHGLGVMLQLREQAQANGMDFELANASEPLCEILRVTHLDSVFHLTPGIECLPFREKLRRTRMAA
jgi:anti-anti-sigma factor